MKFYKINQTRRLVFSLGAVFIFSIILMTTYEYLKTLILPDLTLWESHLITILFSSIIAVILSYFFIWLKQEKLLKRISHESEQRKLIENELRKTNIQLKELNTTKDLLFSIIAHDLKNPFNVIIGFSDLLQNHIKDNNFSDVQKFNDKINVSAKNTLILLDNLMEWAKLHSNNTFYNPQKINLNQIVQDVIDMSSSNALSKNITINENMDKNFEAIADINMLQTILRNLIMNAIKYSKIRSNINIYANKEDHFIKITVSDNGIGISNELKEKLFDRDKNITTLGTADEKGTGLGLFLCKEFVEMHGGKIWFESKEGKGSDFSFTIPSAT